MYCYADHVANTSARCTGVGWGGVGHANVMYACVTCNTPRYATSMCTCVAWKRCCPQVDSKKKNGKKNICFWTSGCQKWAFRWGETHIFKSHQMKTSKIKCFFSRPWWLKLVFRWGETPISTLESCACHRKMIMTLKCPFTKSHKYHVSSFWRENLKIKIGNPSQGAVSTAYLVFTAACRGSRLHFVPILGQKLAKRAGLCLKIGSLLSSSHGFSIIFPWKWRSHVIFSTENHHNLGLPRFSNRTQWLGDRPLGPLGHHLSHPAERPKMPLILTWFLDTYDSYERIPYIPDAYYIFVLYYI